MINLKTKPTTSLKDIKWVERFRKEGFPRSDDKYFPPSTSAPEGKTLRKWRLSTDFEGAPTPDIDSNGDPCLILFYNSDTDITCESLTDVPIVSVWYPNGKIRQVLSKKFWDSDSEEVGRKLPHFALAVLAAWPMGDMRALGYAWESNQSSSTSNASNTLTSTMWTRAYVQGYITLAPNETYTHGKMIRTSKKVNAKLNKSRKMKNSAWPFSEKVHWFNIMSGALQITNTNMAEVLKSKNNRSTTLNSKDATLLKKNFPVFKVCADFKKARKFFEHITEKKTPHLANRNLEQESIDTLMNWDPLKEAYRNTGAGTYSTRQACQDLFANPYAIIKTSIMLGCVPQVEEQGNIIDFKEITGEYLKELKDQVPMQKSVVGIWKGHSVTSGHVDANWSKYVQNSMNVDNLTHMYMILLNETHLLSNDDLLRWCTYQGLNLHKADFNMNFLPSHEYDVFGYKLTNNLDYTCIVWGSPLDKSGMVEEKHAY